MIEPKVHLAYAPRGAGVLYAVLWFADGSDVYGWYAGNRGGLAEASYFAMPGYYAARGPVLYRSAEDDLDGPWVESDGASAAPLSHSPVPQALHHELARLQDGFVRHWLFFDTDADAAQQAALLNARELPVRHLNVRADHLGKLHTAPAVWRYDTPGADQNVLVHLSRRWPLDEELHA